MLARMSRFCSVVLSAAGLLAVVTPSAQAAKVSYELNRLYAMQTYDLKDGADDQAYLVVTGVAKGKELDPAKIPSNGTWTIGPKSPAADPKKPTVIWSGDLDDGEFALLTVTLFQGKGDDATLKAFLAKKSEGEKGVANRTAAKLTADQAKQLSTDLLKAHRKLITNVKEVVGGREKKTDHYGGQFTLLARNEGGKIVKRIDPVGLTFGEDAGIDAKVYTKIKNTRQNVYVKDESGEWAEEQLLTLNDDENEIRVKMLENEMVKDGDKSVKNTTDYLALLQLKVDGKAAKWKVGGEHLGISDLHHWWDYAN